MRPRQTQVPTPPPGNFRPGGAPPPQLRARSTKIFTHPAAEYRPLVSQPMAQQPRRTHRFGHPAVSLGLQGAVPSSLVGEPRRTHVFAPADQRQLETPSLSRRLREETMTELERAKTSSFMTDLLNGELSRERYCRFLSSILEIYTVLEYTLERHSQHPVAGIFHVPGLFRAQVIQQDLDFFQRGRPAVDVRDMASVRGWVQRLTYLSDHCPELLGAHAYMRYTRELSGLPTIVERVARTFRLSLEAPEGAAPRGLAYFSYPGLPDVGAARAEFRARLDALPPSLLEEDDFLREARRAYTLNYAMVMELA